MKELGRKGSAFIVEARLRAHLSGEWGGKDLFVELSPINLAMTKDVQHEGLPCDGHLKW
jgi:hypothetical protein